MANKIPKKAKLVFKGEIFNVYQWRQRMFDGTYKTFERLKRPHGVGIIATIKDKVLIIQEEQPGSKSAMGIFGGRMEHGESPIIAAKRELLEESGMVSSKWHLIKVFSPVAKMDWNIYLFTAAECRKISEQHLDGGERIKINQISFERLMSLSHKFGGDLGNYLSEISESEKARSKFRKILFGK